MAIVFMNRGKLDMRALTLMGVSVKVGSSPVGFFGTGLKYSVAILLRTGHTVAIRTDGHLYHLTTSQGDFRGQSIDQIVLEADLDGHRTLLPFTTSYGSTWSVADAFRELWCNAHDEEDGEVIQIDDADALLPPPGDDWTEIVVRGPEIDDAYTARWSQFLQPEAMRVHEDGHVEAIVSDALSTRTVYYRGIRVMEYQNDSAHTYNIMSHIHLTENRTLAYPWEVSRAVMRSVSESSDPAYIRAVLGSSGHIERNIDWSELHEATAEFAQTAETMRREGTLSAAATRLFSQARSVLAYHGFETATLVTLTALDADRLERAMLLLRDRGLLDDKHDPRVEFHTDISGVCLSTDGSVIMVPQDHLEDDEYSIARAIVVGLSLRHTSSRDALAHWAVHGEWSTDTLTGQETEKWF